jgi:hypothetical protein
MADRLVNYLLEFLGDQWPGLKTNPVLVAMLVGFLLGGIVACFVYWLIHKGKINERNAKIGERDIKITGLEGEVSLLERHKADLESKIKEYVEHEQNKSPEPPWLAAVAESDRTMIDAVVQVLDCNFMWDLEAISPFVSFEFTVFNGSVWPILLNRVKGNILYGKGRLKGEITISSKWRLEDIPHGMVGKIEILQ